MFPNMIVIQLSTSIPLTFATKAAGQNDDWVDISVDKNESVADIKIRDLRAIISSWGLRPSDQRTTHCDPILQKSWSL